MQSYLKYGYGFPATLLTKDEFKKLRDDFFNGGQLLQVWGTQEECQPRWATVVAQTISVWGLQKPLSQTDMDKTCNLASLQDLQTVFPFNRTEVLTRLTEYGLERFIDQCVLQIFMQDC